MKKIPLPTRKKRDARPTRITNETVAEHRERILAGGRRFKYPVQYGRRRLVLNAVIICVVVICISIAVCWQQLYVAQNTSTFFYRLTKFVPVPVASVDGQSVRYSDYLLYYSGSAYYLQKSEQVNFSTEDGKRQMAHIKRESLNDAEADAYAQKIAKEHNIHVTDEEVDKVIDESRKSYGNISERVYNASALRIFGWTPSENRHVVQRKLIQQKVAYLIDEKAAKTSDEVATLLKKDPKMDFRSIADKLNTDKDVRVQIGTSGLVPHNNSDGGLSQAAGALEPGQISDVIKSTTGDGYYVVKLLSKNDQQLNYTYLRVPLTEFDARLTKLRHNHKINEYITVPTEETK